MTSVTLSLGGQPRKEISAIRAQRIEMACCSGTKMPSIR